MIDQDVAAFGAVMRAYALPKSGDAERIARACAALNVRINAGSIRDTSFVQGTLAELDRIVRSGGIDAAG
jgi:formiminotetrahydrofolate cyclodeaminase